MWREKKEKEIKAWGEREGAGYYYCSEEAARRPLRYLAGGAGAASSYMQSLSDTVTPASLDGHTHNLCKGP